MNLGQCIDPDWAAAGCPPRAGERRSEDPHIAAALREKEQASKAAADERRRREDISRQRALDRQAELEAEASKARAREMAERLAAERKARPAPAQALTPVPTPQAKPVGIRGNSGQKLGPRRGGLNFRALAAIAGCYPGARGVGALQSLMDDLPKRLDVLCTGLARLTEEGYLVRSGGRGQYKYTATAKGLEHVKASMALGQG